jgi:hypothetical protein
LQHVLFEVTAGLLRIAISVFHLHCTFFFIIFRNSGKSNGCCGFLTAVFNRIKKKETGSHASSSADDANDYDRLSMGDGEREFVEPEVVESKSAVYARACDLLLSTFLIFINFTNSIVAN